MADVERFERIPILGEDEIDVIETTARSMLAEKPDDESATATIRVVERYRANVESYEDFLDAKIIKHADEAGRDLADYLPAGQVDRLIAGESPIKVWREHRGLSLRALARAAKLSPSYVSEIEAGQKTGSVDALKALADALSLKIDDLI